MNNLKWFGIRNAVQVSGSGFTKIAEITPCLSHDHNPPSSILLSPGLYEYACPSCGHVTRFQVYGTYC